MEHWSGFYLRNALALPAFVGASGVAVYHASMAIGRLFLAGVISHFGNSPTLRTAGLLAAIGMVLALATTDPALVVLGFLVVGMAVDYGAVFYYSTGALQDSWLFVCTDVLPDPLFDSLPMPGSGPCLDRSLYVALQYR
jgi:hypothetical protein